MMKKAFVMQLREGHLAEYEKRHNPIWKELEALLRRQGVASYSIFHHAETNQLFAYAEIEDEDKWAAIADPLRHEEQFQHCFSTLPHADAWPEQVLRPY